MSLVDSAIYVDGAPTSSPDNLEDTYQCLRERDWVAWIGLYRPLEGEIRSVAAEFEFHDLAADDAIAAHQRPKLERYGSTLVAVLRPARCIDETEKVEFGELHVFLGSDFIITVRHAESPNLGRVRRWLEQTSELLRRGLRRSCTQRIAVCNAEAMIEGARSGTSVVAEAIGMQRSVAQKMGIRSGMRAYLTNAPTSTLRAIDLPPLNVSDGLCGDFSYIHLFALTQAEMSDALPRLKVHLSGAGMLWVSWPKGRGLGTDLTLHHVIRIGYDQGLVESTTLSVDRTWSAIKFTHPKPGKGVPEQLRHATERVTACGSAEDHVRCEPSGSWSVRERARCRRSDRVLTDPSLRRSADR